MAVTRHIDWSGPGSASSPPEPPMAPAPPVSPAARREAGRGWLS